MKLSKINIALILIYCIYNIYLLGDLNKRLNETTTRLNETIYVQEKYKLQLDACSELILTHTKMHVIEKEIENIPKINILPYQRYD
jgi:hypothetical protein